MYEDELEKADHLINTLLRQLDYEKFLKSFTEGTEGVEITLKSISGKEITLSDMDSAFLLKCLDVSVSNRIQSKVKADDVRTINQQLEKLL